MKIGDRVRGSQNGEDWFEGIYVEESETFAQYGILQDTNKMVRFYIHAELIEPESPKEQPQ